LSVKQRPKKQKDKTSEDKTLYPTVEDAIRINKAVLGKLPAEEMDKLPESTRKQIERMAKQFKPRPKERIPEILNAIKELWELQSDMRFGQLLLNNVFRKGDYNDSTNQEMYNQEDTETLKALKKILSKSIR
jgi:hypothetical protein